MPVCCYAVIKVLLSGRLVVLITIRSLLSTGSSHPLCIKLHGMMASCTTMSLMLSCPLMHKLFCMKDLCCILCQVCHPSLALAMLIALAGNPILLCLHAILVRMACLAVHTVHIWDTPWGFWLKQGCCCNHCAAHVVSIHRVPYSRALLCCACTCCQNRCLIMLTNDIFMKS